MRIDDATASVGVMMRPAYHRSENVYVDLIVRGPPAEMYFFRCSSRASGTRFCDGFKTRKSHGATCICSAQRGYTCDVHVQSACERLDSHSGAKSTG